MVLETGKTLTANDNDNRWAALKRNDLHIFKFRAGGKIGFLFYLNSLNTCRLDKRIYISRGKGVGKKWLHFFFGRKGIRSLAKVWIPFFMIAV